MSNKKRKKLISPTLSNIPVVEPRVVGDPTGNESLAEFRRRCNREQKEQSEAQRLKVKAFWGRSQNDLALVTLKNLSQSAVDPGLVVEQGVCTDDASGAAHHQWLITAPAGLDEDGHRRLLRYGLIQVRFGKNFGTVSAWQAAHDRLVECDCYEDEFVQQSVQPEKQATRPSFADVEKINISAGTDSEILARRLVTGLMTAEIRPIFYRWRDSLWREFGVTLPERVIEQHVEPWFTKSGCSPMILKNWDALRRSLVSRLILPVSCLRPDEREAQAIENLSLSSMSFDEKRALRNRLQRLQD